MEIMTQIVNTISKALSVKFIEYNENHYYFTKFMDGYDLDVHLTLDNYDEVIEIETTLFGDAILFGDTIMFESKTSIDINSVSVLKEVDAIVENAKNLVKAIETFSNKKGVY